MEGELLVLIMLIQFGKSLICGNDFKITTNLNVTSVQLGIGPVTSGSQFPLTVNLYSNTVDFPNGTPSLIGTASHTLTNSDSFSVISIPINRYSAYRGQFII